MASLAESWTISFGTVGCISCLVRRFVKSSAANALYQAVFPIKGLEAPKHPAFARAAWR